MIRKMVYLLISRNSCGIEEQIVELSDSNYPFENHFENGSSSTNQFENIDFRSLNENTPEFSLFFDKETEEPKEYSLARTFVDYSQLPKADDQNERISILLTKRTTF